MRERNRADWWARSVAYTTATNQFTISGGNVHYDLNGNQVTDNLGTTYTWSPFGNPASINSSTNLIYDALGQMVEQQNASVYTQILYSPAGKTAIMNGQTLIKAFVYLPGGETAIYNSSGLAYYRHADWLGSSRLTTTASRTIYSDSAYAPFGEQYVPYGTADASFTGQNSDTNSTLYDFTFREHSPTQGRWISPDPAGMSAVDPTSPQTWNRYEYVINNPLAFVDPLGLCGEPASNSGWVFVAFAACPNPDPNPSYSPCGPGLGYFVLNGYVFCGPPANLGTILSQVSGQVGQNGSGGGSGGGSRAPWYKNPCVTGALGKGTLNVGIDAIGLIPEAGGISRMIGHGAGYVGVVADRTGFKIVDAVEHSTKAVRGAADLFDASPEGLLSAGLTVVGFIPGLGQIASGAEIVVDVVKTGMEIAECH